MEGLSLPDLILNNYQTIPLKVSQGKYIHKIAPIDVPKPRRTEPKSLINAQEMQQLPGLRGSLQYAAAHSRPDLASRVANLQKGINKPTVETRLEGSQVLKEAQTYAETSVIIRSIPKKNASPASEVPASLRRNNCQHSRDSSSWHVPKNLAEIR